MEGFHTPLNRVSLIYIHCYPPDGATKLAMVTEVHSALSKRELSPLPNYLHVQFDVDGSPVNLRLVRNSNININAPVTFEGEKTEKRNNIAMVTVSTE